MAHLPEAAKHGIMAVLGARSSTLPKEIRDAEERLPRRTLLRLDLTDMAQHTRALESKTVLVRTGIQWYMLLCKLMLFGTSMRRDLSLPLCI